MKLNTEHITQGSRFWDDVNALAKEAFPPAEYLAPSELVKMAEEDGFDFLALTDHDALVGFMAVKIYREMAYLFFLAIAPAFRSKGYGSRAIETLRAAYPGKQQVVDFEMPDAAADNTEQREKRRAFYLKNGYRETGLFLTYLGVNYLWDSGGSRGCSGAKTGAYQCPNALFRLTMLLPPTIKNGRSFRNKTPAITA